MQALRALTEPRHACHACGACCHGVRVRLLGDEEQARIRTLAAQLQVLDPIEDGRLRFADGRCVFLGADKKCQLHRHYGAAAKPLLCQQYPVVLLNTESGSRIGVDPGCLTLYGHWRDGDLIPANARLVPTASVMEPAQASTERALLTWSNRRDASVAGMLRFIMGHPPGSSLPPGLAGRWLARVRAARLDQLLLHPEIGAPVRDALLPALRAAAQLDPERPPPDPRFGLEEEAFAVEVTRRLVFLRLVSTLPVVPAVGMLSLLGAVTLAWTGRTGPAFGRGLSAWSRSLRASAFWSALLPSAEAFESLRGSAPVPLSEAVAG